MTDDDYDSLAVATLADVLEAQGWKIERRPTGMTMTPPARQTKPRRDKPADDGCEMLSEMDN